MRNPMLSTGFSESAKNAKKRFDNIFSKSKKRGGGLFLAAVSMTVICGLCIACTGSSTIGIIGGSDGPTNIFVTGEDGDIAGALYGMRQKYVGNASGVGALIGAAGFSYADGFELYTDSEPYGVGVYTYIDSMTDAEKEDFSRAAAVLICLIDNCDQVKFVNRTSGEVLCETTRSEWDGKLEKTLAEYAADKESFCELFEKMAAGRENNDDFLGAAIINKNSGSDSYNDRVHPVLGEQIIKKNSGSYLEGETCGEGHILLGSSEIDEGTAYYLLTTYGEYGFENGYFVKVAGTGVIPVRIITDKNGNVTEYQEPKDGSLWMDSLKEIFPEPYLSQAVDATGGGEVYEILSAQEHRYAKAYLASINRRDAEVVDNIDRVLPDMNTAASNELLSRKSEYPYWIGTIEKIEDGIRYVYETKWDSKGGGDGVVTYTKWRYDNKEIVESSEITVRGAELTEIVMN